MVREYTERNAIVLKCKPAHRRRQRLIHRTLHKLDHPTPQRGQTTLEAAEKRQRLRNGVMLPVLAKFTMLLNQKRTDKRKPATLCSGGNDSGSGGQLSNRSIRSEPGTSGNSRPHVYSRDLTGIERPRQRAKQALNRDRKMFSPRRLLPPIHPPKVNNNNNNSERDVKADTGRDVTARSNDLLKELNH